MTGPALAVTSLVLFVGGFAGLVVLAAATVGARGDRVSEARAAYRRAEGFDQ